VSDTEEESIEFWLTVKGAAVVDTVAPLCYDWWYRRAAVFLRRGVIAAGGVAVIKTLKSLTYRGDKTRAKYHSSKIFPEYFLSVWLDS
jgi:ribosomal protein S19E (S16A)